MKKMKKNWIVALSCGMLACGVAGAAGLGLNVAKANTEQKFEMLSGAAVCIADGVSGIRWTTTVNEAFYNSLPDGAKEFGVLVTPRNNIAAGSELTAGTDEVEVIPCTSFNGFNAKGEFTYYSSIIYSDLRVEVAQKAYAVELAARAYVKVGETYYYVDEYEACTRSMRSVAYDVYRTNPEYADLVEKYYGTVIESKVASGYFSEVDKTATLTNVNNLANGTYKGSVNAQPVSVVVDGATMTVTGNLYGLTAGADYKLNVFYDNDTNDSDVTKNDIAVQPFVYATLVIDEATDLDYFYLGNDRQTTDKGVWTEADVFGGYYVLANDIDYAGYVFGESKEGKSETPKNLENPAGIGSKDLMDIGLTGMFDGQGYSITNFTPNGAGLFAAINGGTLKNVSISGTGTHASGGAFLSAMMRNATLQNVYVDAGALSMYGTNGLSKFVIESTLENCVFKCTTAASGRTWGGLVFAIQDSTFTNCYAITNRPLSADAATVYDASNQKPADDTSATVWVEGIKRYEENTADVPVWKNVEVVLCDKDGNEVGRSIGLALNESIELAVYKNGVLCDNPIVEIKENGGNVEVVGNKITVVAEGESTLTVKYAVYGKAYERELVVSMVKEEIVYEKTLTFSAKDGLFFDGANVVSLATIFGEGELTDVAHATDTLTLSEGAVLGLTTDGKAVTATQIELHSAAKKVTVNVNAYTLVIDEAKDMDMFHHGGKGYAGNTWSFSDAEFTEADKFDGYYILAKDIDMSTSKFATEVSVYCTRYISLSHLKNVGLTGTFDGNGYRLYNFSLKTTAHASAGSAGAGGGLFAAINGGTVKNVSITNDKNVSFDRTGYFSSVMRNVTLENVYINVGTNTMKGYFAVILANEITGCTFTNCIFVEADEAESPKYYNGLIRKLGSGASDTTTFTDCYVISARRMGQGYVNNSVDNDPVYCDASNCKPEDVTATKFANTVWYEGIKRYESVADLEEAEKTNTFASFSTTYWTVVTGKLPVWKTKA